jgi:HEAT repeat protein
MRIIADGKRQKPCKLAIEYLCQLDTPEARAAIRKDFLARRPTSIYALLRGVGRFLRAEDLDAIMPAIEAEEHGVLAENVLGAIDDLAAAERLAELTRHQKKEIRRNAFRALARLASREQEGVLLEALTDTDQPVRYYATVAVKRLKLQRAVPILVQWIGTVTDTTFPYSIDTKRYACDCLSAIVGRDEAVELLGAQMERVEDSDKRLLLALALARLKDARGAEVIAGAATTTQAKNPHYLLKALVDVGREDFARATLDLLPDKTAHALRSVLQTSKARAEALADELHKYGLNHKVIDRVEELGSPALVRDLLAAAEDAASVQGRHRLGYGATSRLGQIAAIDEGLRRAVDLAYRLDPEATSSELVESACRGEALRLARLLRPGLNARQKQSLIDAAKGSIIHAVIALGKANVLEAEDLLVALAEQADVCTQYAALCAIGDLEQKSRKTVDWLSSRRRYVNGVRRWGVLYALSTCGAQGTGCLLAELSDEDAEFPDDVLLWLERSMYDRAKSSQPLLHTIAPLATIARFDPSRRFAAPMPCAVWRATAVKVSMCCAGR